MKCSTVIGVGSMLMVFLCSGTGSAEVLSWKECVQETRQNYPTLLSAREELRQVRADRNIAVSELLPQVSGQAAGSTAKSGSGKNTDSYSWSISGTQLLFDAFKTPFDVASAAQTLTAQEYNYIVTSSNARLSLRVAFVTLLHAQELITLTQEIVERRKENARLIKIRYDGGREHKGALLTAEADLAQAEFEVARAERSISLAQQKLITILGRYRWEAVTVQGNFEMRNTDVEKPDCVSLASTTPFLKELIARKESALFNYKATTADMFPKVYGSASYGKDNSEWPPKEESWSAGVTISVPLFEGGSRINKVIKAKSQFAQAEADERSEEYSVIMTLEETWKNLRDAWDTVSVKKKYLEATEERARIATAQYSSGTITFNDWIIIENSLVNVKKEYLDAQANLLIYNAYWVQAQGGTLEDDVA